MRLLFIHGGLAAHVVWRQQLQFFARSYTCVAPDLPGHGARRDDRPSSISHVADELAQLIADDKFVPVGHSLGGLIALELARRHPQRVAGVVVIESPVAPPAGHAERARAFLPALREPGAIERWAERMVPRSSPYHEEILQMMQATALETAEWVIRTIAEYDSEVALRAIRVPVLVIDGMVDEARLKACNEPAVHVHTRGGSHYVQLDAADEVNAHLASFLATLAVERQ